MPEHAAPRIRALVVDDSAISRRFVSEALSSTPDIEVVGTAESGTIALDRMATTAPDVVVLDLAMPGMHGLDTLRELKRRAPHVAVLIYSAAAERGSEATLDALMAGADDYALKPSGTASVSWDSSRVELGTKVRAIADRARRLRTGTAEAPSSAPHIRVTRSPVEAIVLGTSLGGPEALATLVPMLPRNLGVPLFIVQHMPVGFTGALAKRLSEKSQLTVTEAHQGQIAAPNGVYIAPGDFHMRLSRRHRDVSMLLDKGPHENGCRPAVDPLFRSAAALYGPGLLGVVLTGMGRDGLAGAKAIDEAGGQVWIQDKQTALSWEMAGAIAQAGVARRTLALTALPLALETVIATGLPATARREGGNRAR
jgi:two-component system, chemotaxis family, protein-glutamate methylesterase/glutaminase